MYKFFTSHFVFLCVLSIVFGSGWHPASQIVSGNFTGNYQFVNNVVVPVLPISSTHASSKGYVDSKFGTVTNGKVCIASSGVVSCTQTCANGQTLIYNTTTSAWACGSVSGSGTVTNVATGNGLTGGPITTTGTLNVNYGVVANKTWVTSLGYLSSETKVGAVTANRWCTSNGTAINCVKTTVANQTQLLKGLNLTATGSIGIQICSNGQALMYNTTFGGWQCRTAPMGSVTSVSAGNGLSGGPITTTGSLNVNFGIVANKTWVSSFNSTLVHLVGTETITGVKTFNANTKVTGNFNATNMYLGNTSLASCTGRLYTNTVGKLLCNNTALGGGVTGSGTLNYIPKFTTSSTLGNSMIAEVSSVLSIGSNLWVRDGTWSTPVTPNASGSSAIGERIIFYKGGGWKTAIGMDAGNGIWFQAHTAGSSPAYQFFTGLNAVAPTSALTILGNGNVGIGTSNPFAKLNVVGSGATTTLAIFNGTTTDALNQVIIRGYGDNTYARTQLVLSQGTSGGSRTVVLAQAGINVVPITGATIGSGALATTAAVPLYLGTANTSRMVISATGNIGIGTTNPLRKLDIYNGSLGINYAIVNTSDDAPVSTQFALDIVGDKGVQRIPMLRSYGINNPGWRMYTAENNSSKPGALITGRIYGQVQAHGRRASVASYSTTRMYWVSSQAWNDTATGSSMAFEYIPTNTITAVNWLTMDANVKKANFFVPVNVTNIYLTNTSLQNCVGRLYTNSVGKILCNSSALGSMAGSGTIGYVPKFTGTSTVGNSVIYENSGNIGIGILNPVAKLQVNGSLDTRILVSGNNAVFETKNLATGVSSYLFTDSSGNLRLYPGSQTGITILNSNGNIGIGTTSPATMLHINNGVGYAAIQMGNNSVNGFTLTTETTDNSFNIWNGAFGSGTNIVKVMKGGSVGIGGIVPSYKLDVAGDVRATNQLISSVVTGTAPLSVASTTMVTNLNANYLGGNLASAFALASHTHTVLSSLGSYVWNGGSLATTYPDGASLSFVQGADSFPSYGTVLNLKGYTGGGGGTLQLYGPYSPTYGGDALRYRYANYDANPGAPPWTAWRTLIDSGNIGSYLGSYVTKTGDTMSGTLKISPISGVGLNSTSSVANGMGLFASTTGSNSYGVYASGGSYGIYATGSVGGYFVGTGTMAIQATTSVNNNPVIQAIANGGSSAAVQGIANGPGATGVYGYTTVAGNTGVEGYTTAASGYGVYGYASGATAYGVYCFSSTNVNGCGGNRAWYSSSDIRLKDNIVSINSSNALSKVLQLQGVSFHWKNTSIDKRDIGFIAQDVVKVIPEIVGKDQQGYYVLGYSSMVPILTEAIKEQQKLISEQNKTIQDYAQKYNDLLTRVEALEQKK